MRVSGLEVVLIFDLSRFEDRIFKTPDPFRIPKKFDRKLGGSGWLGFRMGAMDGAQVT
jgi:hypothetical protein